MALVKGVAPEVMIEFGVNSGLTAQAVLTHIQTIKQYIGIDAFFGYVTTKPVQRGEIPRNPGELVKADPRFKLMLRRRGSLELTDADLPRCDVAFIDGDHGRYAVLRDTALAKQLVKPGGIIIWHDYNHTGKVDVREVLDELQASGRDIRVVQDTWIAFERISERDLSDNEIVLAYAN